MGVHHFNKEVYVERRKQLQKKIGSGLILLLGNEESSMNYKDNCYHFRQDSSFLYYAGIDLPGLTCLIDPESGNSTLFGEDYTIDDIVWMGPQPTISELSQLTGLSGSGNNLLLQAEISKALQQNRTIHILPPYRPENRIRLSELLQTTLKGVDSYVSTSLVLAIVSQREIKEAIEVEEMERAVVISADMHEAAMRQSKPGMKEYEVAAVVEEKALAAWGQLAYPTILTINGQTLHNHYHGNTISDGQMVLCDAGAETHLHYAGDLTRTFPAGTQFTSRQRELYEVVLRSLEKAESLLKPGIQFREVHRQAAIELMKGLVLAGIVKGDPEEAVGQDVHTLFFQCGLGHMIGLDVHDMEDLGEQHVGYGEELKKSTSFGWKSLRLAKTLRPGFTLTVEPGLYFIPELIDRWKAENKLADFVNYAVLEQYRNFGGIRIEDNYLITPDGKKRLGRHLARTAGEVEALRQ